MLIEFAEGCEGDFDRATSAVADAVTAEIHRTLPSEAGGNNNRIYSPVYGFVDNIVQRTVGIYVPRPDEVDVERRGNLRKVYSPTDDYLERVDGETGVWERSSRFSATSQVKTGRLTYHFRSGLRMVIEIGPGFIIESIQTFIQRGPVSRGQFIAELIIGSYIWVHLPANYSPCTEMGWVTTNSVIGCL